LHRRIGGDLGKLRGEIADALGFEALQSDKTRIWARWNRRFMSWRLRSARFPTMTNTASGARAEAAAAW
jgi:hypothetical protein